MTPSSRAWPPRWTARRPTTACTRRCGLTGCATSPRFTEAVRELWPFALGVLPHEQRDQLAERIGLEPVDAVDRDDKAEDLRELWEVMTIVRRSVPGATW